MTIVPEPPHKLIVNVFKNGMRYIFKQELYNTARKAELGAQVDHWNHCLAKFLASNANKVTRLFLIDVTHGFSFPFPMWIVPFVKKSPGTVMRIGRTIFSQQRGILVLKRSSHPGLLFLHYIQVLMLTLIWSTVSVKHKCCTTFYPFGSAIPVIVSKDVTSVVYN